MTDREEVELDVFFSAARRSDAGPDDALMARVLADAERAFARPVAGHRPSLSLWTRILNGLGGWPAMGGVAAAGICGLWIGVALPATVEDFAANLLGPTQSIVIFEDLTDVGLEDLDG